MIRVAVGFRLGAHTCEQHQWVCGTTVDAREPHGLWCRKSVPRHPRHSHMNDIIRRAVKRTQIPVVREPVGLSVDGKRPDGATLMPWSCGNPLAWDVTVPDTFAKAHTTQQFRHVQQRIQRQATRWRNICTPGDHSYVCSHISGNWRILHGTYKLWNSSKI